MTILVISDNPERESFHQIEILSNLIQDKVNKNVDLLVLSDGELILNYKSYKGGAKNSVLLEKINSIITEGCYSFCVISLEKSNFRKLISTDENILEIIAKNLHNPKIFIFCAQSIINLLKQIQGSLGLEIFYFRRRGVSKTSTDFSNQILENILE